MVCLTSCGSQGLPVYTVGARGWHPDRGLSLVGVWYNRESVCEVYVCVEHLCGVEFR